MHDNFIFSGAASNYQSNYNYYTIQSKFGTSSANIVHLGLLTLFFCNFPFEMNKYCWIFKHIMFDNVYFVSIIYNGLLYYHSGVPLGIAQLEILTPHYNDIYRSLRTPTDIVEVAEYLHGEKVFSFEQLDRINQSKENERECLLTSLEAAVSVDPSRSIKVFATALLFHESTNSLGMELLKLIKSEYTQTCINTINKHIIIR